MAKKSKDTKTASKNLTTPVFRGSFLNVFKARKNENDPKSTPKFGLAAIWTPSEFTSHEKELWKAIIKELDRVSMEAFGKPWKKLPSDVYKKGIRNGASKDGLAGYGEGTRFASLTSNAKPGVVDKNKNEISEEAGNADEIYPGCYMRATVRAYAYDKNGGKGVALGLQNLQKIKDGPRLDNRKAAKDDFDEDVDSKWLDDDDDFDSDDDDDFDDDDE